MSSATTPKKNLLLAGIAFTVVVAIIDLNVPSNIILPIVYFVPLLIFARLRDETVLWLLALGLVVLTFLLYSVGTPPSPSWAPAAAILNRTGTALMIVATTLLLHHQIRASRTLEESRDVLERRNAELEVTAEELGQREEEIARQNEELQSQTEELERQGEELRITNEDLAAREESLVQLLELARELTAAPSRAAVLAKVCDSLGTLVGSAAAIVEKHGEEVRVVCHHGFGSEPPDVTVIPSAQSFTALVLSVGQTGYVEDLRAREDIRIPQPQSAQRFLSVMAVPVRVRGRSIATLEAYSPVVHHWSPLEVTTAESVAAQLSISLQNAELVEEVEAQRHRFEAAFRSAPVGISLFGADGKDVRLNPTGAAMLGVAAGENVSPLAPTGARLSRGVFKDGKPVAFADLPSLRVLGGEDVRGEELDMVLPDGRRLSLLVSASAFYTADGKITGGVAAFVDTTASKALLREVELRRREAEEASVRKTRFLAAISHDIRTPANAINLMTELVRRAVATPALASQLPDLAERLQKNVGVLLNLVGDLLDLARFDSGKVELVESEFSLNDLLEDEGLQLRPLAATRGIELHVEPLPRPLWLRTDRVKLARVLGNLIENAIKFTPSGSVRVRAEVADADRSVLVHVIDTGIGIAEEHVRRIFDEFLQLKNPERDASKGSGLGLAICKRLIELLGGAITVRSTPNVGTTFTVLLPPSLIALKLDSLYTAPSKRDDKQPPAPSNRLDGLRVLLVEDHKTTREGTREILLQEGAAVVEAVDGTSALKRLEDAAIDVLLLDLMLPDMDGSAVLSRLRDVRPESLKGVLVLTGDLHERRLEQLRDFEPDGVIAKPIDIETLVAALQAFGRRDGGSHAG